MVIVVDHTCGTCLKSFPAGWKARENHCSSTGHKRPVFECDTCPRYYASESARWQHMEDCNHFEWECRVCDETWPNELSREEHEHEDHDYFFCEDCDRTFLNLNSLQQHLRSRTHLGNPIACPFCKAGYATATGVVHHVERGSCPNARDVNRQQIFHMMKQRDPSGYVTKLLLQYDSSSLHATDQSWNGRGYACGTCKREFGSKRSLDQHLGSAHQQVLYHCPNRRQCGKEFSTLAAAVNHLESESCAFMKFNQVQSTMGNVMSGNRLLVF